MAKSKDAVSTKSTKNKSGIKTTALKRKATEVLTSTQKKARIPEDAETQVSQHATTI